MSSLSAGLIAFSVLVIAAGQLLFRAAAGSIHFNAPLGVSVLLENKGAVGLILAAFLLYGVSSVAWVVALRSVPLSTAYLFNSVSFILVPLAAVAIYGEQLPRFFWLSAVLISGALAILFV